MTLLVSQQQVLTDEHLIAVRHIAFVDLLGLIFWVTSASAHDMDMTADHADPTPHCSTDKAGRAGMAGMVGMEWNGALGMISLTVQLMPLEMFVSRVDLVAGRQSQANFLGAPFRLARL